VVAPLVETSLVAEAAGATLGAEVAPDAGEAAAVASAATVGDAGRLVGAVTGEAGDEVFDGMLGREASGLESGGAVRSRTPQAVATMPPATASRLCTKRRRLIRRSLLATALPSGLRLVVRRTHERGNKGAQRRKGLARHAPGL